MKLTKRQYAVLMEMAKQGSFTMRRRGGRTTFVNDLGGVPWATCRSLLNQGLIEAETAAVNLEYCIVIIYRITAAGRKALEAQGGAGEYMHLRWECKPAFYAVRGHIDLDRAAEIVNAAEGAEFNASNFRHGWLKLRFSELSSDGPLWFIAGEHERPNIRVTVAEV